MTAAVATSRRERSRMPALLALAAAAALTAIAWGDPAVAARGWLAGWFLALSVCVGSAVVALIHPLTGGRWRAAGEPWLSAAASATPLLCLLGAVLVLAQDLLYPSTRPSWTSEGGGSVEALWLNTPAFTIRSIVVLAVFAGLGLLARRVPTAGTGPSAGVSVGAAALGLVLYAVAISVAGLDWLLSLDPGFGSTNFGAQMAITQIGCGFAFAALLGLSPEDARARSDWSGLMLAAVLGAFYLAAMQFLVSWSGDLPSKASWYLARNQGAGLWVAWAVFVLGAALPFLLLPPTAARRSRAVARVAGGLMLTGAWAHLV